ncbi:MAG: efflux RND transporter periplasmic adaptor subunit, partial [Marinobacter sp.]
MANFVRPLGFLLLGGFAGAGATWWLAAGAGSDHTVESAHAQAREPLYWVAPMDPDFRRDNPGKSPMGMDLVPVYETGGSADDPAGTVRISPTVVNNLGVRTDAVIQGRLPVNITTVGHVQYNEDEMAHVHPRVEGWIEALYIKAEGALKKLLFEYEKRLSKPYQVAWIEIEESKKMKNPSDKQVIEMV